MRKSKMDSEMALWLKELHPLGAGTKLTTRCERFGGAKRLWVDKFRVYQMAPQNLV